MTKPKYDTCLVFLIGPSWHYDTTDQRDALHRELQTCTTHLTKRGLFVYNHIGSLESQGASMSTVYWKALLDTMLVRSQCLVVRTGEGWETDRWVSHALQTASKLCLPVWLINKNAPLYHRTMYQLYVDRRAVGIDKVTPDMFPGILRPCLRKCLKPAKGKV